MRWFPFDYQTLEIDVEQLETPLWLWRFVPDYNLNGLSPSVNFPGWQASLRESSTSSTAQCEARAGTKVYPGASLDNMASASNVTYSNFIYRLKVQRPVWQGFLSPAPLHPLSSMTHKVPKYPLPGAHNRRLS